jgi:hypothetical protein
MSPRPAWRYPARSFFDALGSESLWDWLACQDCHMLIESQDRNGLIERAIRHLSPAANPEEAEWTRWYVADLHARFHEHCTGPARRIAA